MSHLEGRVAGRVALVVGAGSGIGATTARLLASEGARVALTDLSAERAALVAESIVDAGGEAIGLALDVRDSAQIRAAVAATQDRLGALHILHANAGVAATGRAHEIDDEAWHNAIAINLSGAFLCAKYALPAIMAAGGGAIVFTSSSAGIVGDRETPAYCAAKGGLMLLTRQLAVDYAADAIRVNCICPGWIDTPFNDPFIAANLQAHAETIARSVPMGRQGTADEVARAVLFLVSDESSYTTGHALVIDGGLTIW